MSFFIVSFCDQTGNDIGTFSGIDKEVDIRIQGTNITEPSFDCSNASATCSAILIDHSTLQVTPLTLDPVIVNNELIIDEEFEGGVGEILLENQQLAINIPKVDLGFTATDVPVGVMVRDLPTPFEAFTE